MLEVTNVQVYNLREAVIAARNPMRTVPAQHTDEEFEASLQRCVKLIRHGGGSGHTNFRTGIVVSFDVRYPQYWSMEAQRYHFFQIVSSSSKMHSLAKLDIRRSCNEYVTEQSIAQLEQLARAYNDHPTEEGLMTMLSNCPMGLELFMHITTNYEQLATIYKQRKTHRLRDWHVFCHFIEQLPYAQELICVERENPE
jgi:hypothetical protein